MCLKRPNRVQSLTQRVKELEDLLAQERSTCAKLAARNKSLEGVAADRSSVSAAECMLQRFREASDFCGRDGKDNHIGMKD